MYEIEYKYLVDVEKLREIGLANYKNTMITQGYLSTGPDHVVRVRLEDNYGEGIRGKLTIKGKGQQTRSGAWKCPEYEYEIPVADVRRMFKEECIGHIIQKVRYKVHYQHRTWEVDVFMADHAGLILAECEIYPEEDVRDVLPPWVTDNVSDVLQYKNAYLAEHGYNET